MFGQCIAANLSQTAFVRRLMAIGLTLFFLIPSNGFAESSPAVLANRLAQRISALVPPPSTASATTPAGVTPAILSQMTSAIASGDFQTAAQLATGTLAYGDVFLFNLVAPMCSLSANAVVGQNPCIATLEYLAWNNQSWTQALTGNIVAYFPTVTPAPLLTANTHYDNATAEYNGGTLSSYVASMQTMQQTYIPTPSASPVPIPSADVMGVMTLGNGPGQPAFDAFNMGTNRRGIEMIFQSFLGLQLAQVRDPAFAEGLPLSVIRQDVFRMASDPGTFTNTCATCHGGIDGAVKAFNGFDYVKNFSFAPTDTATPALQGVAQKILGRQCIGAQFKANGTYPTDCSTGVDTTTPGFQESNLTPFNAWTLNYTTSPHGTFAWNGTSGVGPNSLGIAMVGPLEFRINMVSRIYEMACGQAPPAVEEPTIIQLANYMQQTAGDQITPMVQKIATLPECLGR